MSLSEFFQGANQYLANNPVVHGGTVLVSSYAMLRLGRLLERRKHKKAEHDAIMKQVFKDPKASVEVMRYERDEETGSYKQHVEVLAFDIELANLFPADMSEKLVRAIQDAIETCTAENSVIFLHLEEMLQDDPEWPHLKDELLRDWHRFFEPFLREKLGGILASEHEGQNMEHEQYYPVLVFMPGSKSAHLRILLMKEDLFKLGMLPGVDDEVRVDQAGVKVVNPDSPEMERLQAVQKTKTANDNRNEMMNRLAVTVHRLVDESPSL